MGTRTGNATWKDYPDQTTKITAAKLEAIEAAIDAAAVVVVYPATARPAGGGPVIWSQHPTAPANAIAGDIWLQAVV